MLAKGHPASDWLEQAYAVLKSQPGFKYREQQHELSRIVAHGLITGTPQIAEAPTGTGKTLAYTLGALAVKNTGSIPGNVPLVISTATKALQAQFIESDVPALEQAGLMRRTEVAVAKGKANYICLKNARELRQSLSREAEGEDEYLGAEVGALTAEEIDDMLAAYADARTGWNGDFDTYKGSRPRNVRAIAVSNDSCTGKQCPAFHQCAYYRNRQELATKKIVVVNHDLLLLALKASLKDIENLPLAPFSMIFDEAHHLPEKAIAMGACELSITALEQMLPRLVGFHAAAAEDEAFSRQLATVGILRQFDRDLIEPALDDLTAALAGLEVDSETLQYRFPKGELSGPLTAALTGLLGPLRTLHENVSLTMATVRGSTRLKDTHSRELLARLGDIRDPVEDALEYLNTALLPNRQAKWLFRSETRLSLHASPLEGADVLKPVLWNNPAVRSAVMLSATLRDVAEFKRFDRRVGAPETANHLAFPHTFPYGESKLFIAPMTNTPKLSERKQFLEELARKLPESINPDEGTLIIFQSFSMMKTITAGLKSKFGERRVKVQSDRPVSQLVADHRAAIARGEGSILCGVASLSEGLDLPGAQCTHLVVVSLPFAVPTDPIEVEIMDMLGNKYFTERALPDAMVRLTQIVGRLIRRETDRGRVTIFDRRLVATGYGRKMLDRLPPFQKTVVPLPQ